MFEKIKECHIENDDNKLYSEDDKQEEGKENDIFTINMKNTEEPEEERLKGIYIDMTSKRYIFLNVNGRSHDKYCSSHSLLFCK
jgi:hypothetical protein